MRTENVKKLVKTALESVEKPYTESVIDDAFGEIEKSEELMAEYTALCRDLGKKTVNTWAGYWIANAVGKTGVEQVSAKKSKLIRFYSPLTSAATPPGKKRKEPEALQLMSEYYLEHKNKLPAYIRNHREDIIEMIVEGLPVDQVFAMQIDSSPPEVPASRRR